MGEAKRNSSVVTVFLLVLVRRVHLLSFHDLDTAYDLTVPTAARPKLAPVFWLLRDSNVVGETFAITSLSAKTIPT